MADLATQAAWAGVFVNGILLVVVIVQAEINRRQLKGMTEQTRTLNDTLEHSRSAFHIGERAYIGISSIEANRRDSTFAEKHFLIVFQNGGRTPAWNLKASQRGTYLKAGDQIRYTKINANGENVTLTDGPFVLAGGQTGLGFIVTPPNDPTPEDDGRRVEYFILGEATYEDFMGMQHTFRYVHMYNRDDGSWTALPTSFVHWQEADSLEDETQTNMLDDHDRTV